MARKANPEALPVIEISTRKPKEADGAAAFGMAGLTMVTVLGVLIVISDFRYFARVIPICQNNCKIGMKRVRSSFHNRRVTGGMDELLELAMGLTRMAEKPTHMDKMEIERSQIDRDSIPWADDSSTTISSALLSNSFEGASVGNSSGYEFEELYIVTECGGCGADLYRDEEASLIS